MDDKAFDEFMENVMIPHFSDYKYNNAYELRDFIAEKKLKFRQKLSEEQRKEFMKICRLYDRLCDLRSEDSFSEGLLKGLNADEEAIEEDYRKFLEEEQ